MSRIVAHCRVAYCRYRYTHVTKGHKCGRCGEYAHGDAECYYPFRKADLSQYYDEILPENLYCTVTDCSEKMLHTTQAHHCPICKNRETHTQTDCPQRQTTPLLRLAQPAQPAQLAQASQPAQLDNKVYNVKCPICRVENTLVNPRKIYGLNDECCICYDNKVDVLFPTCYHCCICFECLEKNLL